jgi:hypothetical protein
MVYRMPEDYVDPSGNTEQFRAFAQRTEPAADSPPATRYLMVAIVAAIIVVAAVVAILAV